MGVSAVTSTQFLNKIVEKDMKCEEEEESVKFSDKNEAQLYMPIQIITLGLNSQTNGSIDDKASLQHFDILADSFESIKALDEADLYSEFKSNQNINAHADIFTIHNS